MQRRSAGERVVATGFPQERDFEIDTISRDGHYKGMVTIIEGCDKRCTFCIVPSTRGPEFSRSKQKILEEVLHLRDYGFKEIELLGQTVNHWKDADSGEDFADLLDAVARIPGVERLRFVTSYPRDFTPRMVDQFAVHENICPYLHLPVQSGSNRILQRMGRGYTIEEYRQLAESLRAVRPNLALSTDIIVGFPGETPEDFAMTMDLLREIQFSSVFAFKYSPRPGTAALKLSGDCEAAVADARLQELFRLQEGIQIQINQSLVGTTHQLVVTGWGREPGTQTGRTPCHRVVHFPTNEAQHISLGDLTSVRIEQANTHSLLGSPT
jgi:tRNA-2-methylthio-N6-dimethylallyladenosine synthase